MDDTTMARAVELGIVVDRSGVRVDCGCHDVQVCVYCGAHVCRHRGKRLGPWSRNAAGMQLTVCTHSATHGVNDLALARRLHHGGALLIRRTT